MESINNVQEVTLYTANKIYVKTDCDLSATFDEIARNSFYSEVEQVDFEDSQNAAKIINVWVEEMTMEKIKDLISPSDLNSNTRMVLVNAIYFKGKWEHKFNPSRTKKQSFYLNQNQEIYVDMMDTQKCFRYNKISDLDAKALMLPYENPDISMLIILPNQRNGIGYIESKLASIDIAAIVNDMQYNEVHLALPKFRTETTIDLNATLQEVRYLFYIHK